MLQDKRFLDYANLFSAHNYEKNGKIMLKYFQYLKSLRGKKIYGIIYIEYRKFKYHTFS